MGELLNVELLSNLPDPIIDWRRVTKGGRKKELKPRWGGGAALGVGPMFMGEGLIYYMTKEIRWS